MKKMYAQLLWMFMGVNMACISIASAQITPPASQCGPAFKNAIVSVALECINDTTALSTDTYSYTWRYVDDGIDGVAGGVIGTTFEAKGIALRETADDIIIAINSSVPVAGRAASGAQGGTVAFGDVFINFTGTPLQAASDAKALYGVRFINNNESGVAALGVYGNVKAKSVTATNAGFSTYQKYHDKVLSLGATPSYGDLADNVDYFGRTVSYNVIGEGTYLGPIVFLDKAALELLGYDSARFAGTDHYGFKFSRSLIVDVCGVRGGDGTSCLDCKGVACGKTVVDMCGVCGGNNSTCLDCKGIPNGTAKIDQCGVCGGDGKSCLDCKGVPNGTSVIDQCGVCGGDGKSCLDCRGVPNGTTVKDLCGVCGGDSSSCKDCAGVPNGTSKKDACGVCGGPTMNIDLCSITKSTPTPTPTPPVDQCGVVNGNNSCLDCKGVPHGTAAIDCCGVCGGDGSTCLDKCTFYDLGKVKKDILKSIAALNKSISKYSKQEVACSGKKKSAQSRIITSQKIKEISIQELQSFVQDKVKLCDTIYCTKSSLTSVITSQKVSIEKLLKLSKSSQYAAIKACGGGKGKKNKRTPGSSSHAYSNGVSAIKKIPPQLCN